MEIKARNLRVFCAVVEAGSLLAASDKAGLSPSAISRLLTNLEHDIGIPLFDRTDRRMVPTADGLEFHRRARETLAICDDLATFGHSGGRRKAPQLRVAGLSRHASTVVVPALARFSQAHPHALDVKFDMHAQRDFDFSRLARPFDVGFGQLVGRYDDLDTEVLGHSGIVAALAPGHPLSARKHLTAEDIQFQPIIRLARDTVIDGMIRHVLAGGPSHPKRLETSHTHLALAMVRLGMGIHLTDALAALDAETAGVALVPVENTMQVPFLMFWPKRTTPLRDDVAHLRRCVLDVLAADRRQTAPTTQSP